MIILLRCNTVGPVPFQGDYFTQIIEIGFYRLCFLYKSMISCTSSVDPRKMGVR